MKINIVKFIPIISFFCFFSAVWTQSQSMDNVNQDIEEYKRTQSALLDKQFSIQNRELEESLSRKGLSDSSAGREARAFALRNQEITRQQASINTSIYAEHMASLKLNRNIYISSIEENINRCKINSNILTYLKLAEQGDANAQCYLGWMYKNGQGVNQSNIEAVTWYRKAAEQGNANAQFNLAVLYYYGEGVEKNDMEASIWCRKAAEQGDATAQFYIGNMYKNGYGVNQDNLEALAWYSKSASQGNLEAQLALVQLGKDINY